jgi:tetratricopeptide (TPR) repeat protein
MRVSDAGLPAAGASGGGRAAVAVSLAALFALGGAFGLQKIRCFDYWFHLRAGAWMAEHGQVLRADPFTYTVQGSPWIDIHWLHQLGTFGLYQLGGHAAVVLAKLALVWLLLAVLATIGWRRARPAVTAAALGLMLLVAGERLLPRPELPSFVLLAGVLALLDRHERRGDAWMWGIVPIQVLWVNVHGLFALGLAVVAIHLAAEAARPLVLPGQRPSRERLLRLAGVLALSILGSLANPNGAAGLTYPIQQLGMIGPPEERGLFGSLISELIPPLSELQPMNTLALALFAGSVVSSFAAMAVNWRRIHAADPLLWVAFLYLALAAHRNVALFAIVSAAITCRNLNAFLDANPLSLPRWQHVAGRAALVLAMLGLGADVWRGSWFPRVGSLQETGLGFYDVFHPVGAAEWIRRNRPQGPICHQMADGGYLQWTLWPDYPVMVDGRLEIYGPETFARLQVLSPAHFRALDAKYHFKTVLLHYALVNSDALVWWLYLNSNWRLVFADDVAVVFVREGTGDWPTVAIDDPAALPPLAAEPSQRDQVARMGRTNLLQTFRQYDRALAVWEETVVRYPDLEQGPLMRAYLLEKTGLPAAAEAILRDLLESRPRDPKLLSQVGDLRAAGQDLEAAKDLYDRALAADPRFVYAALRRAWIAEQENDLELAMTLYARVLTRSHPLEGVALQARERLQKLGRAPGGMP